MQFSRKASFSGGMFFALPAAVSLLALLALTTCVAPKNLPPSPPPSNPPGINSCSVGQEWCQGRCVDTVSYINDSNNCGRCGNICSAMETCNAGSCDCQPGFEKCMGTCTSSGTFMSDSQNCGRCGNFCSAGESCVGGTCQKM